MEYSDTWIIISKVHNTTENLTIRFCEPEHAGSSTPMSLPSNREGVKRDLLRVSCSEMREAVLTLDPLSSLVLFPEQHTVFHISK